MKEDYRIKRARERRRKLKERGGRGVRRINATKMCVLEILNEGEENELMYEGTTKKT